MFVIIVILMGLAGLFLFMQFRPLSYPSILLPREEAIQLARTHIHSLCGIDVSDWHPYAMYWNDRETVNRLHHLNMLNRLRPVMYNWGLIESWRIRFVGDTRSLAIGINASGEVTFLHLDSGALKASTFSGTDKRRNAAEIRQLLTSSPGGEIWKHAKITGEGIREEDFSNLVTHWFTVESSEIRMKLSVQIQDNCFVRIISEPEILTPSIHHVVRKEFRDSALNLSSFVGSFLSVIAGVLLLIYTDGLHETTLSLVIAVIMLIAVLLTARDDISMSIVNSFDSRLTVRSVYLIGIVSSGVAAVAYGCIAFITSLAGLSIAQTQNLHLFEQPVLQSIVGLMFGIFTLGLFACLFRFLENINFVHISPELSDRSIFLSGFKLKQCLSISIQSSFLEELIFRLLGVPTLLWLTDSNFTAILVTSILWAFLHQGSGFNPGWVRWVQLTIFGLILGGLYLRFGFLTVVVAHFTHNFVLLFLPLLYYKLQSKLHNNADTIENSILSSGQKYGGSI